MEALKQRTDGLVQCFLRNGLSAENGKVIAKEFLILAEADDLLEQIDPEIIEYLEEGKRA